MLTNAFFKTRTDGKELSNSSMVGRSSETEFTVSLWGFPSGLTQTYGQGIYTINGSFYDTNNPGGIFRIFIFPGGGVKVQIGAGGVGGQLILGNADSPIQMNNWFHLMLVLENNTLNIFVNGQDKTSLATVTGTISTMPSLLTGAYKNYMLGFFNNTTYSWQGSLVDVAQWDSDKSSDISTIYNNGKPGDLTSLSPKNWWKLTDGSLVDSGSEADDAVFISTSPTIAATDVNSNSSPGASSGMTEQNLVNNNVSVLNGKSLGMDTTNLVQSNLTRKQPFSSYSVYFDGAADTFDVPDATVLKPSTVSVSLWLKGPVQAATVRYILSKYYTGSGTAYGFYTGATTNEIAFILRKGNDTGWATTGFSTVMDDTWHHIVGTFDGTTVSLYVDGALTSGVASGSTGITYGSGDLTIGAFEPGTLEFEGNLSNVAIWDSALDQDDILNLYNNGVPQDLNNFRITPVAWYPMDQSYTYFNGSVLVARDVISGNDGTGANITQEKLIGNAPGSEASGTGTNLTIADLKGDMKSSINNSYSINMADYADGVTNPADSGRSTNVP